MMSIQDLVDNAKSEIAAIFGAPIPNDPGAPDGYVTRTRYELETHRRKTAAVEVVERLMATIAQRYGKPN